MARKGLTFPESVVANGRVGTARIRSQVGAVALTPAEPARAPIVPLPNGAVEERRSKYGNKKCEVDGIQFDSRAEARRWSQLMAMQERCEIHELERQVVYLLAPGVVINGRKAPPLRYVADFVYERGEETVIEDVKGVITPEYRIKRHLMALKGLCIVEIK
ncbi:hypothetical protein PCA20602_02713 [Pandoraea capi]|uniref:DUF1064 domain-containing protein n=1 Tax=Pandoraea capi TaxID=2508286 RepID=A0ABY6W0T5_9BURK|nr:DUF1064 domain-containing protein [Pandoraea capi]VVE12585.1 hypothetical protein PCA20602_02713 [Pandoraea capi]